MTGTAINLFLVALTFLAVVVGIAVPLGALGFMFWHWHKELDQVRGWRKKISDPRKSLSAPLRRMPV